MLGGVDAEALDNWKPEPVPLPIGIPEEHKCCCWGQPIGDKLLQIADNLDPYGDTILAQTSAKSGGEKSDSDDDSDKGVSDDEGDSGAKDDPDAVKPDKVTKKNYPELEKVANNHLTDQAKKEGNTGNVAADGMNAALNIVKADEEKTNQANKDKKKEKKKQEKKDSANDDDAKLAQIGSLTDSQGHFKDENPHLFELAVTS